MSPLPYRPAHDHHAQWLDNLPISQGICIFRIGGSWPLAHALHSEVAQRRFERGMR